MRITPTQQRPTSSSASVEHELADLEIDGYRIEFSRRVALLPVELAETRLGDQTDG